MSGGRIAAIAGVMVSLLVAGCGIPQDDRYQTHDGGHSNSRAEAPASPSATRPS